jgi:hypothetical protein
MVALVAGETVLLVVLIVLVAGLLRSHAELLRRVGPPEPVDALPGSPVVAPRRPPGSPPAELSGKTPTGDVVKLAFDGGAGTPTLLAFLTSGCGTCAGFWGELGRGQRLPAGIQTVVVTRGADRESPSRVRSLAPASVPVVMSSAAWEEYRVPGAPYFVLVDGAIRGEGVATTWEALASLVTDAVADQDSGTRRARSVDATLASAGIHPGHASLYPAEHD